MDGVPPQSNPTRRSRRRMAVIAGIVAAIGLILFVGLVLSGISASTKNPEPGEHQSAPGNFAQP